MFAVAVFNLKLVWVSVVALFAEVGRSEAEEGSDGAAEVAFPVDVCPSMLLAVALLGSKVLELAVLAAIVLFLGALSLELLLAVDHASEVWLLAVVALVECV